MIRLGRIRYIKSISKILVISSFITACSNESEEYAKQMLQEEFIKTYQYTADNNPTFQNKSNRFEYMRKINSDAFHSIAYRWHKAAIAECAPLISPNRSSEKSTYEKVMGNNSTAPDLITIKNDDDRECLAKTYQSHWKQINAILELNYPNSG